MGVIGEINRLAIAAWSPAGIGGGYIAAGTYAGAIDPSFTSGASLELLAVDIQNSRLSVATDCRTSEKFCSVAWSIPGRAHPGGLIAGGLDDGTVRVWDAAALLRAPSGSEDEDKGVVFGGTSFEKKHTAAVRAVAFNPFVPTMLASGGADAQILIWDLATPGEPSIRPPGAQSAGNKGAPSDEVTAVAWNRRVQHILGSGTAAGVLHIWDLKQRRQVISIRNPNSRMRCSGIHWHPEIATQVLTTCDQDNGSGAMLWDLRNATAPVMTFDQFASRGVSSASWCPQDAEMIMLSTREPRNVIVSPLTGETLCNLQSPPAPSFDVQWSPRLPGLYLSSSIDAMVTVKSLLSADASSSVSVDTANALAASFGEMATDFRSGLSVQSPRTQREERKAVSISRPPKWLRRPVSVSFGPTGTYATVSAKEGKNVSVEPLPESVDDLRECVSGLDAILIDVSASDPSQAENLCRHAVEEAENADAAMGFQVLSCLMQKDSRRKILKFLGYDAAEPSTASEVYGLLRSEPLASPVRTLPTPDEPSNILDESNAADNLAHAADNVWGHNVELSGPAPWDAPDDSSNRPESESVLDGDDDAKEPTANGHVEESTKEAPNGNGHADVIGGLSDAETNSVVRKALVVGDLKKAMRACLAAGRTSDALVIAHAGGPDLWLDAQSEYLSTLATKEGGNVLGAIAGPLTKMDELLHGADDKSTDAWKEALAVVLTYVPGTDLAESCSALGQRLLLADRNGPALVCFLCAGNTKMSTSTWMQNRPATGNRAAASSSRMELLVSLVRKVRLITSATLLGMGEESIGVVKALDEVSGKVLCEFGGLLAVEGELDLAVTYLANLDPEVTGVYGSAGDLLAQASGALSSMQAPMPTSNSMSDFPSSSYGATNYSYGQQTGMNYNQPSYAQPAQNWNQAPVPPPATNAFNNSYVPPPAAPAVPSPQPQPPTAYSTTVRKTERSVYNPSSAYEGAPSYDSYSAPPPTSTMPPVPPQATTPAMPQPPAPMPSMPAAGSMVMPPAASMAPMPPMQTGQPMMPPMQTNFHGGGAQNFEPPPPPPPPTDEAIPTSYHAKAKPGLGSSLPPSAEVAVAAQKNQLPGGLPKRSISNSSNLSSIAGNDPAAYLDRADVRSIPPDQQVIVKSLRGAYGYALKRSSAMMYRKKMEDVNKKLGRLVAALNNGGVDGAVVPHLIEIGKFIEKGNYDQASRIVTGTLTKQFWDNNSQWIPALKRLIDTVLTGR